MCFGYQRVPGSYVHSKKIHIKTYGCQMNVYDSVKMAELMAPHGYDSTDNIADADLIVLNTCHIREKAAEKVYSEMGRIRQMRDRRKAETGQDTMIAVAGCVAQAEGELMAERAPFIDIVLGPQVYHRLPEMVAQRQRNLADNNRRTVIETDFPVESKFDHLPTVVDTPTSISSFLSIQEGCDKFCSFCVVPYTRGAEESRPVAALLHEARDQVTRGAREITLLGQNVNAYHGQGLDGQQANLATLLEHLSDIPGLERIRYTTSHPRDMDETLIAAHRDNPRVMPYLHLPVQSGSDSVLKAMNRGYTADDYLKIVDRLRQAQPDMALSSDFIVGFPGESDEDFEATMRLVEIVEFAQSFSFKYSRRPGTPASGMRKQIHEDVKDQRLSELQALLNRQSKDFNRRSVGRTLPVLIERRGRHPGQLIGRTPQFQAIHFEGPEAWIGSVVDVVVEESKSNSLAGRACQPTWEACA